MARLREATRDAHDRIERALPLFDPSLTRERYRRILEVLHGFYVPLEPVCARVVGDNELTLRAKVPLLRTDLRALGCTPTELLALPSCNDLPIVERVSQALGVFYVLEGATLGGQIIHRHLRTMLAIDTDNGGAFFAGYRERTREMWSRFSDHVNHAVALDVELAVVTAIATFMALERWLIACRVSP